MQLTFLDNVLFTVFGFPFLSDFLAGPCSKQLIKM